MKSLIVHAVVFTLLQVAVATGIFQFYRVDSLSYFAALRDKHALLASRPSPRLVLIGGSNVAFGFDSSLIADALPYEPVNVALHAGLGLQFMLRRLEPLLRPGDIVVLSPEYQHFTGGLVDVLLQLLEQDPASIRFVPPAYVPTLLDGALNHAGGMVRGSMRTMLGRPDHAEPPYVRNAFNRYGDVTLHWRLPQPRQLRRFGFGEYSSSSIASTVSMLNAFHERLRARQAALFFLYPTIPTSTFAAHKDTIREIEGVIAESLNIRVLNRPGDATLPIHLFFDTHYHLTRGGATHRTKLLIDSLRSRVPGSAHTVAKADAAGSQRE